ncbi:MAG: 50S ribosomal protein L29 [Acidimicrobiia bacterium]
MARKKNKEFKDLEDRELLERLSDTKQELFNLRFQHVTGQLDNTARLGHLKKDVARIETELRAREIAAAEAAQETVNG